MGGIVICIYLSTYCDVMWAAPALQMHACSIFFVSCGFFPLVSITADDCTMYIIL